MVSPVQFSDIPTDVLPLIVGYMLPKTVCNFIQTCKAAKEVLDDENISKVFEIAKFNIQENIKFIKELKPDIETLIKISRKSGQQQTTLHSFQSRLQLMESIIGEIGETRLNRLEDYIIQSQTI